MVPDSPRQVDSGKKEEMMVAREALEALRNHLEQAENALRAAKTLLTESFLSLKLSQSTSSRPLASSGGKEQVIEGVFDGTHMIGADSRRYPVPPNYASKSKLVVGDILKLTIADDGTFIFKQIGPVERRKLIGQLRQENGRYFVEVGENRYQVLGASVTYYRAKPGDKLTIIIPRDTPADWAAVENLVQVA